MAILGIHIILVILGIFQSTAIVAMKNWYHIFQSIAGSMTSFFS
jgi:hypothetical protein